MSVYANSQDEAVMVEADRWFARLHAPDCTAAERVSFERWRSADVAHSTAYASAERLWRQVGDLADDPEVAAAFAKAQIPTSTTGIARQFWTTPIRLAAGLAVVAMLGLAIYRLGGTPDTYRTELGEQRKLVLADGSDVTLDTATALRVEFESQQRVIYLDEGRAHFSVARDSVRPFIVKAGGSEITALGTAFDVRNERNEVTVTLVQGRVEVRPPVQAPPQILAPGERVTISAAAGLKQTGSIDVAVASGWTRGNLIFRDTALQEAITEINRYTKRKIRIGDAGLASLPISGVFHVGDAEAAVIALERSFPIKAIREPGEGILLVRDASRTGL